MKGVFARLLAPQVADLSGSVLSAGFCALTDMRQNSKDHQSAGLVQDQAHAAVSPCLPQRQISAAGIVLVLLGESLRKIAMVGVILPSRLDSATASFASFVCIQLTDCTTVWGYAYVMPEPVAPTFS